MDDDEKTPEQLRDEAVAAGDLPSNEDLQAVARGGRPKPWRKAFSHPIHGDLVFEMEMPTSLQLAAHAIEMDNLLADLYGQARGGTTVLVSAIAGLKTLVKLPEIGRVEERSETEDDDDHRRVRIVYYDPEKELDENFLVDVWMSASTWRLSFIQPGALERLGKASGETRGSGSGTESAAPTVSPSTTPA